MASQEFLSILSSYRGKLEGVRTFLEDLRVLRKKKEDGEDILGDLTALEGAQVQLALAFAASSLFFSYLKTEGFNVATHPITQDLMRVQQYMRKVATVIEQADPPRRTIAVNAAAAKRVVAFHTSAASTLGARGDDLKGEKKSRSVTGGSASLSVKFSDEQESGARSGPREPSYEEGHHRRDKSGRTPDRSGEDKGTASPVSDTVPGEPLPPSPSVRTSTERVRCTGAVAGGELSAKTKRKRQEGEGREKGAKKPFFRGGYFSNRTGT